MIKERAAVGSPLLAERDAATFLNLSARTLQNWRVAGREPSFVKIGRRVQYRVVDLEDYLATCVRRSTADDQGR
jgi:hypothetical protein